MRAVAIVAAGFTVLAGTALAQEAAPIEYKWKKGDVLRYRIAQDRTFSMEGFRYVQLIAREKIVVNDEVADVSPEGTATIHATYEAVHIHRIEPNKGHFLYDSTKKGSDVMLKGAVGVHLAQPTASLVGQKVTFKVDKNGKVTDVSGFEKVIEKAMATAKEYVDVRGLDSLFTNMIGNEIMTNRMDLAFRMLPTKPVKEGDSWNQQAETPFPYVGMLKMDRTFTLAKAVKTEGAPELARADMASKMTLLGPWPDPSLGQREITVSRTLKEARSDGHFLFDREAGKLVKSVAEYKLAVDAQMKLKEGSRPHPSLEEGVANEVMSGTVTIDLLAKDAPPF